MKQWEKPESTFMIEANRFSSPNQTQHLIHEVKDTPRRSVKLRKWMQASTANEKISGFHTVNASVFSGSSVVTEITMTEITPGVRGSCEITPGSTFCFLVPFLSFFSNSCLGTAAPSVAHSCLLASSAGEKKTPN